MGIKKDVMDYKDYYSVLGVSKTSTPEEIRSAFRKKAREHHPDHRLPIERKAEA